jgi:hypothetical protein
VQVEKKQAGEVKCKSTVNRKQVYSSTFFVGLFLPMTNFEKTLQKCFKNRLVLLKVVVLDLSEVLVENFDELKL